MVFEIIKPTTSVYFGKISRSRSWSRLFLVSVSNLRSRNLPVSISVLVSEKLSGLGLGLRLDVCGLDYIIGGYSCTSNFHDSCRENKKWATPP